MSILAKVLGVILAFVLIPTLVGFFVFRGAEKNMFAKLVPDKEEVQAIKQMVPPDIVRAVYLTAWASSNKKYINEVLDMKKNGNLNAVVVDIKDFSGYLSYDSHVPEVEEFHTKDVRIPDVRALTDFFHQNGIYVIGRITVFQDPALSLAKPEWTIKKRSEPNAIWTDYKGLAWIDPAEKGVWDYIVKISDDAVAQGFDELNFDYIRFPSDGDLTDTKYPAWDEMTSRRTIIRSFFRYLRENLPSIRISVDLFGFTTTKSDDLGIGQKIEDAYESFDVVSPILYPSHYPPGAFGFENPADHPYEIFEIALSVARGRLHAFSMDHPSSTVPILRPWVQDFNLGAIYDVGKVKEQIRATKDVLGKNYHGFALWNASNIYTVGAFQE